MFVQMANDRFVQEHLIQHFLASPGNEQELASTEWHHLTMSLSIKASVVPDINCVPDILTFTDSKPFTYQFYESWCRHLDTTVHILPTITNV